MIVLAGAAAAHSPSDPVYGPADPEAAARAPVSVADHPAGVPDRLAAAAQAAATTYPSITAARASVRAARRDMRAARQLRYPSVSVEGVGFAGGSALAADNNITANLVVEQPLWTGGRISGTIRRADAVAQVAAAQVDETARDLELRVIEAFYTIAGAARRDAILARGLEQHRALTDTIARRVDQGVSPKADLSLARSRTAQIEQQLALNAAQRLAAVQRLRELVGDSQFPLGMVAAYDPAVDHPDLENLVEEAVTCDPARTRFFAEAAVARAEADIAKAQILPQVLAEFSSNEITGQRVGIVLRAQSNGGFSQIASAQSAALRATAAQLQIATAERAMRETMALDIVANLSTRERIRTGADASNTAEEVTASYQRQFVAGRRTWLDVMNAVREATSADLATADAEVEAMSTTARLLLRSCRWQPAPRLGAVSR